MTCPQRCGEATTECRNGLSDGGLVIDLSPMKGIRVDPGRRTVRAEAGVLWGVYFPLELAPKPLRFYRDWIESAPDELTTVVNLRPAVPFLPQEIHEHGEEPD
jgi:hypothetical protein